MTAGSAPSRPTAPRRSKPAWSFARSAIAGFPWRACRSTNRAPSCPMTVGACSTRPRARGPATTSWAGSSAVRPASSARTRRTPKRPSTALFDDRDAGRLPEPEQPAGTRSSASCTSEAAPRQLRRLGSDRSRRARARRAARSPASQALHVRGSAGGRPRPRADRGGARRRGPVARTGGGHPLPRRAGCVL